MDRNYEQVLKLASLRNKSIPPLLNREEPYFRRDPQKVELVDQLVAPRVKSLEVEGGENIDEAVELAQRGRLMVVFNHITEIDTVLTRMALTEAGFGDFEARFIYFSRMQIFEDEDLLKYTGADNNLPVITPYQLDDLKQAQDFAKEKGEEGKVGLAELQIYNKNADVLNKDTQQRGWILSDPSLGEESRILALFPEAEFQTEGIIRPPRSISALFARRKGEQYILPMLLYGHQRYRDERVDFVLKVGQPFDASESWVRGSEYNAGERVMASVLRLNPTMVNPKDRDFYGPLL